MIFVASGSSSPVSFEHESGTADWLEGTLVVSNVAGKCAAYTTGIIALSILSLCLL